MLAMRGGSQVGNNGVKMARPPPVPPRPDKSVVADALAKSRKVPAPVLPPGLKKELAAKNEAPPPQNEPTPKSPTNKLPSPKLNGLSRVKSFIRDVINDKKSSEDKKAAAAQAKDKELDAVNGKNGVKSHIPIPQSLPPVKTKNQGPVSLNYPTEESVKNQSSQSVVRSLCSVLMNSDKDKTPNIESTGKVSERIRIIKSNSFAEKAIPVRKAPPPPISPKPTKKQVEEKLARVQQVNGNVSVRKLSASCEELNASSPRPVVYQSPSSKKLTSPMLAKKVMPPSLPSGKPPLLVKKKSTTTPPAAAELIPVKFSFQNTTEPTIENDNMPSEENCDSLFGEIRITDENNRACVTEKLISEIIAAKNDALVAQLTNKMTSDKDDTIVDSTLDKPSNITNGENAVPANNDSKILISNKDDRVNCVNISCSVNSPKTVHDNVSLCSSDSSSGGGKTVLFINSETFTDASNPLVRLNNTSPPGTIDAKAEPQDIIKSPSVRFDDIANHELLISELQGMRRVALDERVNKRQRQPSLDTVPSSPDSISGETQNIQHSDWVQVEDNGRQVRYSSCQIVIEDSLPSDSGICLDDNFYSSDSVPYSLSPSLVSRLKEQFFANQKMSSLQGLPPLPKSLSGFNVTEGGPPTGRSDVPPPVPARSANSFRFNECASPSSQSSRGGSSSPTTPGSSAGSANRPGTAPALNGTSSSSSDNQRQPRKLTTLDTQLAVLKREMLSLRQLDLSLLSQLWSLNESIHEFRQYLSDRGSGPGHGGIAAGDDDLDDDADVDADDSSSGGEEPTPPPAQHPPHQRRGRTPV